MPTGNAPDTEDSAEDPLISPAVSRWDDVADDGLRRHDEAATAEPLDRAEEDELHHASAQSAQDRSGQEEHDGALEHALSTVEIPELAIERGDDGLREQVGGDDPRKVLDTAELAHDRGEGGGDDGRVERGKEHGQDEAAEDDEDARLVGVRWY